ncbi:transmembrane signal receptor [Lithospermum erythrorhizon]|uniref:Transmembrane signal receptor n=1 Tax=Lithospermum erythrorhizon TaxID=34254 RepID=A0AAV3PAP7_LITER
MVLVTLGTGRQKWESNNLFVGLWFQLKHGNWQSKNMNCKKEEKCPPYLSGVITNLMLGAMAVWNMYSKLLINLLMFPVLIYASKEPDIEGEALIQLLEALNDSSHSLADWNYFYVSPCQSWSHVTCSEGKVVSLSLGFKRFSGTLSPSITKLKFLVSLDLQGNKLSGPLPDYLGSMQKLQILNLADNNFNGSIPASWGQLSSLKHMVIRGNHLTGSIPDSLAHIPGLVHVDLSSNDLSGNIPVQLFSVPTFNFSGTHLTCGSGFQQPCASSSPNPAASRSSSKVRISITGAVCGAFILLFFGAFLAYQFRRARKDAQDIYVDVEGMFCSPYIRLLFLDVSLSIL